MYICLFIHLVQSLYVILSQLRHNDCIIKTMADLFCNVHTFILFNMCVPLWCTADPGPPTGVQAVAGTVCNTSDVSWSPSQVNYGTASLNYSVRYRLRDSNDMYTTVYSSSTNVTLRGLDPSADYDVIVVATDSCGRQSGSSDLAQLNLQGNSGIIMFTAFPWYLHTNFAKSKWNIYLWIVQTHSKLQSTKKIYGKYFDVYTLTYTCCVINWEKVVWTTILYSRYWS